MRDRYLMLVSTWPFGAQDPATDTFVIPRSTCPAHGQGPHHRWDTGTDLGVIPW
jgi:hypothetical protein